jgi:competence protein ComEC
VLHKEIPFLRIGLPLCAGIISGLYINPDLKLLVIVLPVIAGGFLISLFYNKRQSNHFFGLMLLISLFTSGLVLYTIEKKSLSYLNPERSIFICSLSDYAEEKQNSFSLIVKLEKKIIGRETEAVNGSMLLYLKKDTLATMLVPGDLLVIRCTPAEIVNRGNPYEFDYRFFMENHGVRYSSSIDRADILNYTIPSRRKIIHKALIIRERIINMFRERGISGERLALVSAITLGQKRMLDPEQKLNFMKAGVMHIMAVSGLHALILSLFVLNLLFFMKGRFNILRIGITILVLWAFAFVTGLTPSVLRASLMFTFLQAGKLIKRPANGINSVLASAVFLILIRPSVIFDAGFLLSYSAVIYIICFYRDFYRILKIKNWLGDKIWQSVSVTMVAQAGTLPLTILLFNRFPTYFILANLTIIPVTNLLIICSCLVPMFFHLRFLSVFLAILADHLAGLTDLITASVASLPFSTIENIGSAIVETVLLTSIIFLLLNLLLKKGAVTVFSLVLFLSLYVFTGTTRDILSKTSDELIVYNIPGVSAIGIRTGKILNLFCDASVVPPDVKKHCSTLGLKLKVHMLKEKPYIIRVSGKTVFISGFLNNKVLESVKPDVSILFGFKPKIDHDLNQTGSFGKLVISSGASSGFRFPPQIDSPLKDSVYIVRKSGAYIKRI